VLSQDGDCSSLRSSPVFGERMAALRAAIRSPKTGKERQAWGLFQSLNASDEKLRNWRYLRRPGTKSEARSWTGIPQVQCGSI